MPGPSLTQFDAARKHAAPAATSSGVPGAAEMYQATGNDTPTSAFEKEIGRTASEAGKGLLRSPLDLVKNTLGMVAHPIDAVTGTVKALAHPVDTFNELGAHPRDAGSLLGQILLGKVLPEGGPLAGNAADLAGRGLEATGRGMTAVGESAPARGAAALNAIVRPGMASMAELAIPPALEYGGRGVQAAGAKLRGLKAALTPAEEAAPLTKDAWAAKAAEDFPYQRGEAPTMGSTPDQNPSELYPYQKDSLAALKNVSGNMTPKGDLMSEYLASTDGPVKPFTMDGETYAADASGSHVRVPPSNEGMAAAEIGSPGAQAALERWRAQPASGTVDKMSLEGSFGPEQKAWAEDKYGGEGVVDLSDASAATKPIDIHQQLLDSLKARGGDLPQDTTLSPLDQLARLSARSRAARTGQPIAPDF